MNATIFDAGTIARKIDNAPDGSIGKWAGRVRGWDWIVKLPTGDVGMINESENPVREVGGIITVDNPIVHLWGFTVNERGVRRQDLYPVKPQTLVANQWSTIFP